MQKKPFCYLPTISPPALLSGLIYGLKKTMCFFTGEIFFLHRNHVVENVFFCQNKNVRSSFFLDTTQKETKLLISTFFIVSFLVASFFWCVYQFFLFFVLDGGYILICSFYLYISIVVEII